MVGLGEQGTALKLRELVGKIVRRELDVHRPNDRMGTVATIDPDGHTCTVRFRDGDPITVRIGALRPNSVGDVVRVRGGNVDPYIADILGGASLNGPVSADIATPATLTLFGIARNIVASWGAVPYISHYELQVAEDDAFTINPASFETIARTFTVDGLVEGSEYWARVRGVANQGGSAGAWSPTQSLVVPGFPDSSTADGAAPSSSPTALVKPTIGMLLVEWVPTPNNDLVTYEVHVGSESGFTPNGTTLYGETTGNFYAVRTFADESPLPYNNPTFVRLIAKDTDGSAPAGVQGSGTPDRVTSGDFTQLVGDGDAPSVSPATFQVIGAVGFLYLTWDHVTNDDQVTYEIHMSETPGFTPTPNTLAHETVGNFAFVKQLPAGLGGGPLQYDTTYHMVIWAKDPDGYATNPSAEVTGTPVKNSTGDIQPLSITRALIGEAAIGEAQIEEATITTALIQNGAIVNAKIGTAAVGQANIATAAVGSAQIANASITDAHISSLNADKIVAGTIDSIDITGVNITGSTITGSVIQANDSLVIGEATAGDAGIDFVTLVTMDQPLRISNIAQLISGDYECYTWIDGQRPGGGPSLDRMHIRMEHLMLGGGFGEIQNIRMRSDGFFFVYADGARRVQMHQGGNFWVDNGGATVLWNAGTTVSDRNLKQNIEPAPGSSFTELVRQIDMVSYEFRDADMPQGRRLGLIAQDAEPIYPQGFDDMGTNWLMDTPSMTMLALGAVKDVDERLRLIEARLAAQP